MSAAGKKGGRPRLFASKLREALIRKAEEHAEPLAEVLVKKALEGDLPSIKEMIDRGIGKAIQAVDVTTDGESLNELGTLSDEQLKQLAASVAREVHATPFGAAKEDSGEPVEVRS